ncbi:MAG: imidazole glycerol phosphate synthase subunit HisH [Chloroflexi bacterium]|nr:imidazole glycerol phosphate synthase subunit HisH [Chloroflexota bacterium]
MIALLDYGVSNLRSVENAFRHVGADVVVTSDARVMARARAIAFPGQGAFGNGMQALTDRKLLQPIRAAIADGKPFFGICLGLQLLFADSDEMGQHTGLGIFPGHVRRFNVDLKVPHMGWNQIHKRLLDHPLLEGVATGSYGYFDHSYVAWPQDPATVVAYTDYGLDFPSVIARGNVYAIQFHPEKSQQMGLEILRNFLKLCGEAAHVYSA